MLPERTERSAAPPVPLAFDEGDGIGAILYRTWALQEGAVHFWSAVWATDATELPDLGELRASGENPSRRWEIRQLGSALCYLELGVGQVFARVAAGDLGALEAAIGQLRTSVPTPAPDDVGTASIRFWHVDVGGAASFSRRVDIPDWSELRGNYPAEISEQLDHLLTGWAPSDSGQLLLWHGPPGTGKTHALRALAGAWHEWCSVEYIVDPEVFFGPRPDYMVDVLLHSDPRDADRGDGAWRLLVLEDAGELLAADAKERGGQAVSRLLNLVDGLIGQSLRVLVLVTGNEPLTELYPALSRPGRCASLIEFREFAEDEADGWLIEHGWEGGPGGPGALSDLYATLRGHERLPARRPVGFV